MSLNTAHTDLTGSVAGRHERTAHVSLTGSPGAACEASKPATQCTALANGWSSPPPPTAPALGVDPIPMVTSVPFASSIAACAAAIAAIASDALVPPSAASSRQISRYSDFIFECLAQSFIPISTPPSRSSHPSRLYTGATESNRRLDETKSPASRYPRASLATIDAKSLADPALPSLGAVRLK